MAAWKARRKTENLILGFETFCAGKSRENTGGLSLSPLFRPPVAKSRAALFPLRRAHRTNDAPGLGVERGKKKKKTIRNGKKGISARFLETETFSRCPAPLFIIVAITASAEKRSGKKFGGCRFFRSKIGLWKSTRNDICRYDYADPVWWLAFENSRQKCNRKNRLSFGIRAGDMFHFTHWK